MIDKKLISITVLIILLIFSPLSAQIGIKGGPALSDIVFANILAGTLVELKTQLLTLRKAQGVLVLSGILQSQQAMIYKEFEPGNTIQSYNDGDWMMMSVTAQA